MSTTDKTEATNMNQKQASGRANSEIEKQINPSVKVNPRQETDERSNQQERSSRASTPAKTTEKGPTVDATRGGI